jgi:hypothetical protein
MNQFILNLIGSLYEVITNLFKKIQELGIPDVVSFDYDLADVYYEKQQFDYNDETQEKTGYHCAKWLTYYCIDNKKNFQQEFLYIQ